ncbi:hypothetical protein CRUP_008788 [Coryphaenoides rupestris]|nr:hypothetical protein CRUP_008788 [Coryphaenoides rupestris]
MSAGQATYVLLALAWVFVPVYVASGIVTMPEYLGRRFGGERIRTYLAVLSLILSIFTKVISGLAAVIYTDTLQTVIMIVGAIILTITAFNKIGGYSNLESVYSVAVPSKIIPNSTCHLPRQDAMHLFRDATTGDLPWPGMTLGLTILGHGGSGHSGRP